jgi:hypothetical protein
MAAAFRGGTVSDPLIAQIKLRWRAVNVKHFQDANPLAKLMPENGWFGMGLR